MLYTVMSSAGRNACRGIACRINVFSHVSINSANTTLIGTAMIVRWALCQIISHKPSQ